MAWLSRSNETRHSLNTMPIDFFFKYGKLLDPTGFLRILSNIDNKKEETTDNNPTGGLLQDFWNGKLK